MSINVDHVGVVVPDLALAIDFYAAAFGLSLLREPQELSVATGSQVYGDGWPGCRMAHLADAEGRGIELFEVPSARSAESRPFWRRAGLSHVAFSCGDLAEVMRRVEAAGGTVTSPVLQTPRLRLCFVADPWGTMLELVDTTYGVAQGGSDER